MNTSYEKSRWTIPLTQRPLLREALQSDAEQIKARREQRRLIREICSLPEVRALPPEEFFIAFKQAVNDVATDIGMRHGPDRDQLLSRLLSLSIEEFFQTDGDGKEPSTEIRSWSSRLGLSTIRQRLNGNANHSKDEACRGTR